MCLMCVEIVKNNLNKQDFVNNYLELVATDPKHAEEVLDKWLDKLKEEPFELE